MPNLDFVGPYRAECGAIAETGGPALITF